LSLLFLLFNDFLGFFLVIKKFISILKKNFFGIKSDDCPKVSKIPEYCLTGTPKGCHYYRKDILKTMKNPEGVTLLLYGLKPKKG
jgi:hypothetical protein